VTDRSSSSLSSNCRPIINADITVSEIRIPGGSDHHGAETIVPDWYAFRIITPQDGINGLETPMNASPALTNIAYPTPNEKNSAAIGAIFGRICFRMIRTRLEPVAFAARINGRSLIWIT